MNHTAQYRGLAFALAGGVAALAAAGCAAGRAGHGAGGPDPTPVVRESRARVRVGDDPMVVLDSTVSLTSLPPRPPSNDPRELEQDEGSGWERASWTRTELRLPDRRAKTIEVAAPSILLLRARWTGPPDLAVTVLYRGTAVGTASSSKRFDGAMIATAQVAIPAAGPVTIQAAAAGSRPVDIELFLGVLTSP